MSTYVYTIVQSPLGDMLAVADDQSLILLTFLKYKTVALILQAYNLNLDNVTLDSGEHPILISIKAELADYFDGKFQHFKTPLQPRGSLFQKRVWDALVAIPYGEKRSYKQIACTIDNPQGCRAVALANKANPLVIIVPCHRVINHDGSLGGYNMGIERKSFLLALEAGKRI